MVLFGVGILGCASVPVFPYPNLWAVLCIKRRGLQPTVAHSSHRFDPAPRRFRLRRGQRRGRFSGHLHRVLPVMVA